MRFVVVVLGVIAFFVLFAILCRVAESIWEPRTREDSKALMYLSYVFAFGIVYGGMTYMIVQGWIPPPMDFHGIEPEHLPANLVVCPDGSSPTLDGRCS
jgi:hypothetical protein